MEWFAEVDVAVIGAGGGGLVAAITAAEAGWEVALLEKTTQLLGNTAASAGMIPASETSFQKALHIKDSKDQMVADIMAKNQGESDVTQVRALVEQSGELVEWLHRNSKIDMSIVEEFTYPGHSVTRMHAPPKRSGMELMKGLQRYAKEFDNLYIVKKSPMVEILKEGNRVYGVQIKAEDGIHAIKAKKIIVATNGFGANKQWVQEEIEEMKDAPYFGYEANDGDGIRAVERAGGALDYLTSYQGH
ncbi:MAG: FAD-dependent oxidoreductase, partial [Kurthia sp.]